MRRTVWRAAALALAVLALGACASSTAKPASPGSGVRVIARSAFAGQPAAGDVFPTVTGGFGEQPHIAAKAKDTPASPSMAYISEGTGDRVAAGAGVEVRYVKADWASGRILHDSWAAGIAREKLPASDADIEVQPFLSYLRVGSRIEIVNPGPSGITVYVVDVLAQVAPSASPTG